MLASELSSYAYSARVQSKIVLLSPQSKPLSLLTLMNNIVKTYYLKWRQDGTPFMDELCESAVRTTFLYFSESSKD
jgi:hypothetical protein